jgi:hypothetical protein
MSYRLLNNQKGIDLSDLILPSMTSLTAKASTAAKKRKKYIRQHQHRIIVQDIEESYVGLKSSCETSQKKKKKKKEGRKRSRGVVLYRDEEDGKLKPMPPTLSSWYNLYCAEHCEQLTPNFDSKFRRRFRLPYAEYKKLVALCVEDSIREHGKFCRWRPGNRNVHGLSSSPIELLVLTSH